MFKCSKLVLSSFLIIITILYMPYEIYADDIDYFSEDINISEEIAETSSNSIDIPDINSRAAVVIDRNSNTILFGKNENDKRKMASTTKIMTALIVIENANLNDTVTVSKNAAGTGGSRLGLKTDDKVTVNNLLYGLMLCSGNDAAVALAEYVSGSIEGFAHMMNAKASILGLNNTHFVTPHGLDKDEHYTTAYELALLTNYALKNETFAKIVNTQNTTITINGYSKSLHNTNELLGYLNGVYGVKTGFTNGANRCLVTACKRDNLDIICVVLGADTKKFRTKDSIKLIEYAFANYSNVNIQNILNEDFNEWKNNNSNTLNISKGISQNIDLNLDDLLYNNIAISNDKIKNINTKIYIDSNLNAPIYKNTIIGHIDLIVDNDVIYSCNILSNSTIKKRNVLDYISIFLHNYYSIILENKKI